MRIRLRPQPGRTARGALAIVCLAVLAVAGPAGVAGAAGSASPAGSASASSGPRHPGRISLLSLGRHGAASDGYSYAPAISANGGFVSFTSRATDLVRGDTNGTDDIFVCDVRTRSISRVSISSTGSQSTGVATASTLSADGRYVAFASTGTDLVAGATSGLSNVFVRDRLKRTTSLVSVGVDGAQPDGFTGASDPSISADGRYVSFTSDAANLVAGDTNGNVDVFVRDLRSQRTQRVSLTSVGGQSVGGAASDSQISADGHRVAFRSDASDLVAGDTNALTDIFVRDLVHLSTVRVSVGPGGAQSTPGPKTGGHGGSYDPGSYNPSISADGRYVSFTSYDRGLVPGSQQNTIDIYLHDAVKATTQRIALAQDGSQGSVTGGSSAFSGQSVISADGRFVSFNSNADNLVTGDTNQIADIFVRDLRRQTIARVSVGADGSQANGDTSSPVIDGHGRHLAFMSDATNLVHGDVNAQSDIFFR